MIDVEEQLIALFRKLVPEEGKADTVAGEIVRAINFIGYRLGNSGEEMGYVGCDDTVNSAGRYLMKRCSEEVKDAVVDAWASYNIAEYKEKMGPLMEAVLEYLETHPELEHTKNTEDMRKFTEGNEFLILEKIETGFVVQYREDGCLETKYMDNVSFLDDEWYIKERYIDNV